MSDRRWIVGSRTWGWFLGPDPFDPRLCRLLIDGVVLRIEWNRVTRLRPTGTY